MQVGRSAASDNFKSLQIGTPRAKSVGEGPQSQISLLASDSLHLADVPEITNRIPAPYIDQFCDIGYPNISNAELNC